MHVIVIILILNLINQTKFWNLVLAEKDKQMFITHKAAAEKLKLLKKSDPEFFNNYINKKKDEIYAAIYSKNELLIFYKKIEYPPDDKTFDRFNVIGIINMDGKEDDWETPIIGMVINANPLLILWRDERINTWGITGFIKTKLKKIEQVSIYWFVDLNRWYGDKEEDVPFIRNFTI